MVERIRSEETETSGPSQAEFSDHLARRIELKTQIARLSKRVGTIDAQWEAIGGDAQDLKDGEKLHHLSGLSARQGRIRRFNQVAFWMGLITYDGKGQASAIPIFEAKEAPEMPAKTDERLALARAEMDGYNSGWAGGTPENNPHPPGTELYTIWDSACRDGQREKADRKAAKGQPEAPAADAAKTKPDAAKRGPGRPPKAAAATPAEAVPAKPQRRRTAPAAATEAPATEPASTRPRRRRVAEPAAEASTKPGWQGDRDFTDTTAVH